MESSLTILVAEDEPLIGLSVEDALREAGFGVELVDAGTMAMAVLDAGNDLYVALITDVRLGLGPSGWDVARHARKADPSFPIVYVSGDSAHEHGVHGVPDRIMVQKPFAPVQIVTAVTTLLNARHPA
ncbi:MAG: response regulator [Sphingomicrobium sp.]